MRSWREIAIATHNASIRSLRGLSATLPLQGYGRVARDTIAISGKRQSSCAQQVRTAT
jgi:hypothetical protein